MESVKKITITVEDDDKTVQYTLCSPNMYIDVRNVYDPIFDPVNIYRVSTTAPKYFSLETDVLLPIRDDGTLVTVTSVVKEVEESK